MTAKKNDADEKKNDAQNLTKYEPTPKQLKLLEAYLNPDIAASVTAVCKDADVSRTTYYEWMKDEAFCEWFWDEFNRHKTHIRAQLVKIGVRRAKEDHRYWADMMRRMDLLEGQLESGMKKAAEQVMGDLYDLMSINRDEG